MKKGTSFYEVVNQTISYGARQGILQLVNEDDSFTRNRIILHGKSVLNFGSCSYLGLEFDPRLKTGAKEAIDRYGTQFSESRAYLSLKLYGELEELLNRIFDGHCLVSPTTTLGHIAAIPVLVEDDDVVLLDHQVHNSIQMAAAMLKPRGIPVEILRHNRMEQLEERIRALEDRYRCVWYMADGIYSMFGDGCPVGEVYRLLDLYPGLRFYVDDAHGMSLYGKHGRGFVLDGRHLHPRMVLVSSLNKAFASGGGVLVFPDAETALRVRSCGGPMLTSGPMQPAALGSAIAAAGIHLSDEILDMQAELRDKSTFARKLLEKLGLPVVSPTNAGIFFIGAGLPKVGYNAILRMLDAGFYLNLGIFPAVPMKQTGIRFTITRLHRFAEIEAMITRLAEVLPRALREEGRSLEDVYRAFKLAPPEEAGVERSVARGLRQSFCLKVAHARSIRDIDPSRWDALFADKGSFDWQGLASLETAFSGNRLPEDNWVFDYVLVTDEKDEVVAATFLTTAWWKEDMLSPGVVSQQVEEKRKENPYYLVSRVIATGSLLTEGEHVFIRRESPLWKEALQLLLEKVGVLQDLRQAESVVIRDFHAPDPELDDFMVAHGFFRIRMPDSCVVDGMDWQGREGYYQHLSKRSRQHYREDVRKLEDCFEVSVQRQHAYEEDLDHWYGLYTQVKEHSLELNTFPLPRRVLDVLLESGGWEVLLLKLKPDGENGLKTARTVCMVYCYASGEVYSPMFIGLDYGFNGRYKIYRQALYRLVMRARELDRRRIYLGFSAVVEKRKVGARVVQTFGYMQNKDSYQKEVLESINREPAATNP